MTNGTWGVGASAHAVAHTAVLCDSFTVHSDICCVLEDV